MTTAIASQERVSEFGISEEYDAFDHFEGVAIDSEQHSLITDAGQITTGEVQAFRSDDAMAGGMVGVILGIAFTVLLGLVTAVNIWMSSVAAG